MLYKCQCTVGSVMNCVTVIDLITLFPFSKFTVFDKTPPARAAFQAAALPKVSVTIPPILFKLTNRYL